MDYYKILRAIKSGQLKAVNSDTDFKDLEEKRLEEYPVVNNNSSIFWLKRKYYQEISKKNKKLAKQKAKLIKNRGNKNKVVIECSASEAIIRDFLRFKKISFKQEYSFGDCT